MHRSDLVDDLQESYPEAFLLLCQIARRARVEACPIRSLSEREAFVGDFKKAGITSRQRYRTALSRLKTVGLITTRTTNKGTIAKLSDSRVFTERAELSNQPSNHQLTTNQPSTNHQPTTKNNVLLEPCNHETLFNDQRQQSTPEEIYQAYPRKVAKPQALKAIKKALKTISADDLLKLTVKYASARSGAENQFTPHPATWFSGERYNDDPETWRDRGGSDPGLINGRTRQPNSKRTDTTTGAGAGINVPFL